MVVAVKENLSTSEGQTGARYWIHSFFVIPMAIALAGVVLVIGVKMLVADYSTPDDILAKMLTVSDRSKWKLAFTLAAKKDFKWDDSRLQHVEDLLCSAGRIDHQKLQFANEDQEKIYVYMLQFIQKWPDKTFIPLLVQHFYMLTDAGIQRIVCDTLFLLGPDTRIRNLMNTCWRLEDYRFRLKAIQYYGICSDPLSYDNLITSLQDSHENVRYEAALSLLKRGSLEGLDFLEELLTKEKRQASFGDSLEKWYDIVIFILEHVSYEVCVQNGRQNMIDYVDAIYRECDSMKLKSCILQWKQGENSEI